MQTFDQSAVSTAPPEEVWKLLYDPTQFPLWWAGTGSVQTASDVGDYTMYPEGYPDFPMAQLLDTTREQQRITVSCLVSDLRFDWGLEPLSDGRGTRITVDVEIPEAQAARLEGQREAIRTSLANLAELSAVDGRLTGG